MQTLQGNNGRNDKTCPNQDAIKYKKLSDFVTLDKLLSIRTLFCQLYVTLDNFLSFFCSLTRLDSDMFLSIRPLFPCSEATAYMAYVLDPVSSRLASSTQRRKGPGEKGRKKGREGS